LLGLAAFWISLSVIEKGVSEVLGLLVNGLAAYLARLFSYVDGDWKVLFRGLDVGEPGDLYVEKTIFKLGKTTAKNIILDKCVDVLIQTMHMTHEQLGQVREEHRIDLENMEAEQDKLQRANTTLTGFLDEHRTRIQIVILERDGTRKQNVKLKEDLAETEQEKKSLKKELDHWCQKFLATDSKRLAAKRECDRLLQENERLTGEIDRQKVEEARRKMEEFERKEAAEAERRREEEKKRQERKQQQEEEKRREAERQRKAEEEKKRKANEKAEQQKRAHEEATAAEEERCRKRDTKNWGKVPWTPDAALNRFNFVEREFTSTNYSMARPITFGSIPWPVLENPTTLTLEDLNWESVESFLRHTKKAYAGQDSAAYAKFLKQIQLMFHPDRWRSRNLLQAVMDAKLREGLEKGGKIVSQAVNQWIQSRL
jgi:hypothetical protein